MDFIVELWKDLVIIINESNLIDFDEVEKIAKNVKSTNLINKNVLAIITILVVAKIKKLKTQILKLKVELKDVKYVSRKNQKSLNIRKNRKPLYKRLNCKPIDKKNLKYYKYRKKGYFKSEYQLKPKDWIDYRNVWFLEIK